MDPLLAATSGLRRCVRVYVDMYVHVDVHVHVYVYVHVDVYVYVEVTNCMRLHEVLYIAYLTVASLHHPTHPTRPSSYRTKAPER